MYLVNSPLDIDVPITYETGIDEPLHPDFMVASRFIEIGMSDCSYGCKIYADPRSDVKVLAHMSSYGCDVDRELIDYYIEKAKREHPNPDWVADMMVESVLADLANMLGVDTSKVL